MSNEKNRIGNRTAGNANILSILGDLLSSDGIQALRVPLGTPGQFLAVDLSQECGIGWETPGGGGSLTFSDGVTRALDNVTNDLVTATPVAQVDAIVTGSGELAIGFGGTNLNATGAGGLALLSTNAGADISMTSERSVAVLANTGSVSITSATGATMDGGAGQASLTNEEGTLIRVKVGGDIELSTLGHNIGIATSGAGTDITVTSQDDLILTGGNTGATADVSLTNVATGATLLMDNTGAIVLVVGNQGQRFDDNGIEIQVDSTNSGIVIDAGSDGASTPANGTLDLIAKEMNLTIIDGPGNGDINITADTGTGTVNVDGGTVELRATNAVNIFPDSGGSFNVQTAGAGDVTFNLTRDEIHNVGRDFTLIAAGSGGIDISATHNTTGTITIASEDVNVILSAGAGDGTGQVQIQPGTNSATRTFKIFDGLGSGQQTVAQPSGGTVIDAEARNAINNLISALSNWGWLTSS